MIRKSDNALVERALKLLADRHRAKDLVAVDAQEGRVRTTGADVLRVSAASKGKPNAAAFSILVDKEGREVHAAAAGVAFAAPSFPIRPVPLSAPSGPITITPTVNTLTLNPGETKTETIIVKVPKDSGVSSADIYFLADTTGSMGTIISAVISGANAMLAALSLPNLAFGVGNYRDFPDDAYAFQHQLSPTTNPATAAAAIGNWTIGNGGDGPEGQLFALDQLAEAPGGAIGWRPASKRIIVWFGDAPGHDPVCKAISSLPYDIDEASVTAKLVNEHITVLAISTTTSYLNGLDDDPVASSGDYGVCAVGGAANQASRITAATGGQHATGIDPTAIVTTIVALVTAAVGTINNLKLVPAGGTTPFVSAITPASGYGPLPLDTDYELKFDVQFTGQPCADTEQHFTGTIDVVADDVVVAQKRVDITVPPCAEEGLFVYSVKVVCGKQTGGDCCCPAGVRPGVYSTEVNIHNFNAETAKLRHVVVPLINSGAVVGRDPSIAKPSPAGSAAIEMPPGTAMMDDCCRITELLLGATPAGEVPLTIGILAIVSNVELSVSAVYTATPLSGDGISIDVEYVQPRLIKRRPHA